MSKKQSQLDKAIASIDADIAVLQAARARLTQQQQIQRANPKPRVVKQPAAKVQG